MNGNFLVYKNSSWRHKLSIFDPEMKIKEIVKLDFIPEKTFNVDCITYPGFFYMIYQYQKKNILHCMGVKMDGDGKKISEPVELDTTQVSIFAENKIYSTITSEDKQRIMVFKIQKKYDRMNMVTLLFDNGLQLLKKSRLSMPYSERRNNYGDIMLDNEGNMVTTLASQTYNREYNNDLTLIIKNAVQDSFSFHTLDLNKVYIDEVKLKIDNLNKRYLINALYYKKNNGNVEGLFSYSWDNFNAKGKVNTLTIFSDSLRDEARRDSRLRVAFDEFDLRQVIVKKDGGYLLMAEDVSVQSGLNNIYNRNNNYNSPYSIYPNSYYSYNPFYNDYYRPASSFINQNKRYFYANILVFSMNKDGVAEWTRVIQKDQIDESQDNFLSYFILNSGGELHFLYSIDKRNQIISDESITPDGSVKRNPTLKSEEKGYQFMTRLSKQVGARQLLIPCQYRGYICFAKVDL